MKKEIHPRYFDNAKISCVCGAMFEVGSTVENMEVEICSQCHPFYTGKTKIVDATGQVEKFKARAARTKQIEEKAKSKKQEKTKRKVKNAKKPQKN